MITRTWCLGGGSALLLVCVGLTSSGCDDPIARVCDLACDCTGCSDDGVTSCLNGSQATYESSVEKGCTAEADAYLACYEANVACHDGALDVAACEDKKTSWYDCLSGTSAEPTVCDEANDKLVEQCGLADEGVKDGECAGAAACTSSCLLAAPCEEIDGEAEGGLGACLQACQTEEAGGS